jgi:hypothetical protein
MYARRPYSTTMGSWNMQLAGPSPPYRWTWLTEASTRLQSEKCME